MPDPERGTDRAGRRAKRFLSPSQKYEIFLQLVRQEATILLDDLDASEEIDLDRWRRRPLRSRALEAASESVRHSL